MVKLSFEVRDGTLETLPNSMTQIAEEQKTKDAQCFFHAEAGVLLNEPEEQITVSIPSNATPPIVLARIGETFSWFFGRLETEISPWNYLKVTFVNLKPHGFADQDKLFSQMTTNAPELPEPSEQPADLMIHHVIITIRDFFLLLRGSVELTGWLSDTYWCDWVSMSYSKAPRSQH